MWFGNSKPRTETFLKPFVHEAQSLFTCGFKWRNPKTCVRHHSRVMFPILVADAPARAMLTNMKQFNGFFGCGQCLHEGETTYKINSNRDIGGNIRVYPLTHPLPVYL